jgi:MFS family permease
MILPIGFAMGWFFPSGLKLISQYDTDNHLIPWAVSINGFASVLGSIVALPISITLGFSYLFIIALSGYILAGALSLFSFRGNPA